MAARLPIKGTILRVINLEWIERPISSPPQFYHDESLHSDSDGFVQRNVQQSTRGGNDPDNEELRALGYVPSFRREFTNLATISYAFSILGVLQHCHHSQYPLASRRPCICYLVLVLRGSELPRTSRRYCRDRQRISNLWNPLRSLCSVVPQTVPCKGPLLLSLIENR